MAEDEDEWADNIEATVAGLELRIKKVDSKIMIAISLGGLSLAGVVVTNVVIKKLVEGFTSISQVVANHDNILTGGIRPQAPTQPVDTSVRPDRSEAPRHLKSEDETVITDVGPMAEPAMGPESQTSERVRQMIESDPIDPKEAGKENI